MLQKISYECFDNIINHLCIHFLEKRFDKDLRFNQKGQTCHIFYNEMKDLLYLMFIFLTSCGNTLRMRKSSIL